MLAARSKPNVNVHWLHVTVWGTLVCTVSHGQSLVAGRPSVGARQPVVVKTRLSVTVSGQPLVRARQFVGPVRSQSVVESPSVVVRRRLTDTAQYGAATGTRGHRAWAHGVRGRSEWTVHAWQYTHKDECSQGMD